MSDEKRAVRLVSFDQELGPDEVDLGTSIEEIIAQIASEDSLDPIIQRMVCSILALAIVQGVTPHAVIQLLMDAVPPVEQWPKELLQEKFT